MINATAQLASEYWKLLKSFERAAAAAPEDARGRLLAQARYANARLEGILTSVGMRVVAFDGERFEINMPAVAINFDDYGTFDNLIVESTLEPAIISDMLVIVTGKVYLAKAS